MIYGIRRRGAVSPMVTLTEVSKIYIKGEDRICGLDHVNLDVSAGTFCAFVGPSGCGKSTLLNLIAGLDVPTSGTIHLDGRSTASFSSEDWTKIRRQSVGIVFQAFHLIPGLTVEEKGTSAEFSIVLANRCRKSFNVAVDGQFNCPEILWNSCSM